ncbi:MAG: hypothetical protein JW927_13905 [Deltaproteobacteria bacterium]|nr:hypothetical protein [Deltaproteobacteria bacterium]
MNKKYIYAVVCVCFVIAVIGIVLVKKGVFNDETPAPDSQEQANSKTAEMPLTPGGSVPNSKGQNNNAGNPAGLTAERVPESIDNTSEGEAAEEQIDPELLAEAEIKNTYNRMFETEARSQLPLVSIQTHNPVWKLEQEAEQRVQERLTGTFSGAAFQRRRNNVITEEPASENQTADKTETNHETETGDISESEPATEDTENKGPEPAPENGEFGKIQPPDGEIWIRIEAEYASESKDIMAQNADLYRVTTGYEGPVTVTLWVGGRPHMRQVYE